MEVKIGVLHTPREIVVDSTETQDAVEQTVTAALRDREGALVLADQKGRRVIVPAATVAYVEIGEADHRPVGFSVPE